MRRIIFSFNYSSDILLWKQWLHCSYSLLNLSNTNFTMLEPEKQHFQKSIVSLDTNISCFFFFLWTDKTQIVMCLEIHIGLEQKMEVCVTASFREGEDTPGANSSTLADPCRDTNCSDWRENCLQIRSAGALCSAPTLHTYFAVYCMQ